jgi:dipeptidyl aminopeptidase/acylaminoacyl peptidase
MRTGVALLLAVAAAPAVPQRGPAPPPASHGGPITADDIATLSDMRDVEISPDGRTVLFTVTAQMATFDSPHSAIWRVPGDGSAPASRFIVSAGVDTKPRWSPDGRRIAFLSNRPNPLSGRATGFEFKAESGAGPGTPVETVQPEPATADGGNGTASRQLWTIDPTGGEAQPLTALPNDIADFSWSPDGKRIAFLSADAETPQSRADRLAKKDTVEVDKPASFTRLWILDLATHTAKRVSPAGIGVSAIDWSPDGTRLAVRMATTTSINDYFYHSRIAVLDPATGAIGRALLDHAAGEPRWSPDGRSILSGEIRTPGFIGLGLRILTVGGGVRTVADAYPGLLTDARWSPDGRSLIALSFEKTRSHVVRIDVRTGKAVPLAALDGEATDLSTAAGSTRLAVALSSPDRPADVWTMARGHVGAVTSINPVVASWRLGRVREIEWRSSRDGRPIYGVLVTPPGYIDGTPIKTVVQLHGGPEWAWWSGWLGSWHEWGQMLATHGYAVLLPNIRGSDGQGTDFARAVGGDWGGADYQDLLDGVDDLVKRSIADPARLGIGGWSYGGFLSAWAVTHGYRFKAAVVGAAPVDMAAMARITDTPDFTAGYFGEPQANLAALDRVSPVRLLDRVSTPVLVLHGGDDTRVPPTLGLEFYRGLRLLGKEAQMVRYPREPHWFHEPEHQADVQRRVLAWFDAHL